jgi:23S rRNA (uracil1939-C5)-methyltransferase
MCRAQLLRSLDTGDLLMGTVKRKRTGEVVELVIHGLTASGSAVGRHESGLTLFVGYALPGERVRVRIRDDKGRYAFADLLEILTTSPERIAPPCPHFGQGRCGGCDWQHIDYSAQLHFKQQIVAEQLKRIGHLPDIPVEEVHPSPDQLHYRLHATFRHQDGHLGFISTDDRSPYWIDTCQIIEPALQAALDDSSLRHAIPPVDRVRLITDGERVSVHHQPAGTDRVDPSSQAQPAVFPEVLGVRFRVSPGSFFQANRAQAETLVRYALEMLRLVPEDRVIDVYCGVGLFTVFAADVVHRVLGIEQSTAAVRDARYNTRRFGNVRILEGDAASRLLDLRDYAASVVIVDPPRAGLAPEVIQAIAAQHPQRWLYVSCDPTTFARDARMIVDRGYQLVRVKPVDMFPQTHHIELIALFVSETA